MITRTYKLSDIGKKIIQTFGPTYSDWRTVGGIERDTGVPQQEITDFINEHNELFIQSSISPGGKKLIKPVLEKLRRATQDMS